MKLNVRNAIATALVAAIVVPCVGYLVNGSMPFTREPRGWPLPAWRSDSSPQPPRGAARSAGPGDASPGGAAS